MTTHTPRSPLAIVILLTLWGSPLAGAAPTPDTAPIDETDAANQLSDFVNQGRSVRPVYTDPEQVTSKSLLELIEEADQSAMQGDAWMEDPFATLERDMGRVARGLTHERTDEALRGDQDEIIRKLDVLIKQLEQASKNCASCGGNGNGPGSNNPTSPMNDSQLTGGPGGIGELRDPGKGKKQWADLPPKQRDKILQAKTDGFPAGYEEVLEEYYRRLAETGTTDNTPLNNNESEDTTSPNDG